MCQQVQKKSVMLTNGFKCGKMYFVFSSCVTLQTRLPWIFLVCYERSGYYVRKFWQDARVSSVLRVLMWFVENV